MTTRKLRKTKVENVLMNGGLPEFGGGPTAHTMQLDLPVEEPKKKTLPPGKKFTKPVVKDGAILLTTVEPTQEEIDEEMSEPGEIKLDLSRLAKEIVCVFTTPRLTFSDNMFCTAQAMNKLGIATSWSSGVFWEQCLTRLIEKAIKDGYKYIVTLDYDSVFSHEDIIQMYVLMESHQGIDALCPLQLRRGDGEPLSSFLDENGNRMMIVTKKIFELDLIPIATGHFGLTFIRTDKIMKMAKPWFIAEPNLQGEWEDGKIDSDIMFWRRWGEAGNTVYCTPTVHIGHIEYMVTWANEAMQPVHQQISDYHSNGKPDHTMGKKLIELGVR